MKTTKYNSNEQKDQKKNSKAEYDRIFYRERRQRLKSQGICVHCGKQSAVPDRTLCAGCLVKRRKETAEARRFYRDHHICIVCGKRKAEPNRVQCVECDIKKIDKGSIPRTEKQRERMRTLHKQRYYDLKANGMCVDCGRKAVRGKVRCIDCRILARRREQNRKEFPNLDRNERPSYGLCYVCGEPIKEGKKLCEKHYAAACKNIAYARNFVDLENHPWQKENEIRFAKRLFYQNKLADGLNERV